MHNYHVLGFIESNKVTAINAMLHICTNTYIHTCFTSIADVRNDKVEEPAGSPHQAYLIFIIWYHIHTTIKCQIITTRWMKMTTNMYVCIFIFWHVSDISVEAINLTYLHDNIIILFWKWFRIDQGLANRQGKVQDKYICNDFFFYLN